MGNAESGIEVQNRTDIEIQAVAVNSIGMKVGEVLVARCGAENKFKSDKEHAPLMKRLESQKLMGNITQEEYDEMKTKYENARKMEREMDAMEALKDVRTGNVVMPHGEILGTTKIFPYEIQIYFAETMRGVHPQFRESAFASLDGVMGDGKVVVFFDDDGVACILEEEEALEELNIRAQKLKEGALRPKVGGETKVPTCT